ncbi:hypothetical protein JW977_03035 [Candidatus Falkowbacteria bacterium]|nr:hypothetical protein [Candidatus Falkowbacteria bacterium]
MKIYHKIIIFIVVISFILAPFGQLLAFEFDPNDIISDGDLTDFQSMNLSAIAEFLNNQNGVLKSLITPDNYGVQKLAAEIIFNAAQTYKINPKWILATLQKEQSLITNPTPSQKNIDWAMGYAVCDSCSIDDPQVAMFKGFGTQVDRGTWRIRYYYDHASDFNFLPGKSSIVDNQTIVPYNQSTANLYNYTPHLHGNFNFWNIWNRWFAKIFPDGTIVKQTGDSKIYLIANGKRRLFWSNLALTSRYANAKIIEISKNDLLRYEEGYPIKYANFSLLRSPANKIYLIVGNEKKEIESDEVFRAIGYNPDEIIDVTDEELGYYLEGRKITLTSLYPQGALLQDSKTGGVFYVEDGIKYPIWSKDVLNINYNKKYSTIKVTTEELDKYVTAANGLKIRDGILIKSPSDPKVYVISNGQRRWVANENTFISLGYSWTDIFDVTDKVLSLHPQGENLDLLIPTATIATNN